MTQTSTATPTADQQARWTRLGQSIAGMGRARDAARAVGDHAAADEYDAMIERLLNA